MVSQMIMIDPSLPDGECIVQNLTQKEPILCTQNSMKVDEVRKW